MDLIEDPPEAVQPEEEDIVQGTTIVSDLPFRRDFSNVRAQLMKGRDMIALSTGRDREEGSEAAMIPQDHNACQHLDTFGLDTEQHTIELSAFARGTTIKYSST